MVSKILKFGKQKGSTLLLPARLRSASQNYGRAGALVWQACPPLAGATSFLAAHFAKRNTKFGGGGN